MRFPGACHCLLFAACLPVAPAHAQERPQEVVLPLENVRYDYAQVLAVEPVYQTLRATGYERRCDEASRRAGVGSAATRAPRSRLVREDAGKPDSARPQPIVDADGCLLVPVVREFRRPIAFDVDYIYKGSKFRTRMGEDPGNRLKVRVSITPVPSGAAER